MKKIGKELSKEDYVVLYMSKLRKKLLTAFKLTDFSAREEQILSLEKETCELSYFSFVKKNGRGPDESILDEEIGKAMLERVVHVFGKSKQKMNEEQFVLLHLDRVKMHECMKVELLLPDTHDLILSTEKNEAQKYFRLHDTFSGGYEHLAISRSDEVVSKGLSELMEQFLERNNGLYSKFRRLDVV